MAHVHERAPESGQRCRGPSKRREMGHRLNDDHKAPYRPRPNQRPPTTRANKVILSERNGKTRTPNGTVVHTSPRSEETSAPPMHPARTVGRLREAGLLARGSWHASCLPGESQWLRWRMLFAHSCGGSHGLRSPQSGFPSPCSLLIPVQFIWLGNQHAQSGIHCS